MIHHRPLAQLLVRTSPLALLLFSSSHAAAQPTDWQARPKDFQFDDQAPYPEPKPKPKSLDPDAPPPPEAPPEPKVIYAPEPRAPAFGQRGEWVLTAAGGGSNGAGISHTSVSNSQATFFSASLEAGLDYFVTDHLSLGFDVGVSHSDDTGYGADSSLVDVTYTNVYGGVRLGADVPLGDTFSFYPRLTLGVERITQNETLVSGSSLSVASTPVGSPSTSIVGPWVSLYAPLLIHAAPHLFVGLGPQVNHTFANTNGAAAGVSGQLTNVGGAFVLGGWWGGDTPPDVPHPEDPAPAGRQRRFGDKGTWVITNGTNAYALAASYAGTSSSRLNVLLQPGFDFFVADHISIGLDTSISYSRAVSPDTNGAQVVNTSTSVRIAPRFGAEIPLSESVSLYGRAEIGAGPLYQNESEGASQNDHTSFRVWIEADLPVVVHVASHFFVGAGPSVYHELSSTDQAGFSFPETTFGASALIGGWL